MNIFRSFALKSNYQCLPGTTTPQNKNPKLLQYSLIASILINLIYFLYLSTSFSNNRPISRDHPPALDSNSLAYNNSDSKYTEIDLINATAIFNEVHNVLKQKNADLNPISVSYFPAFIPEGTLLYHSTRNTNGQIPESFEWVAMDYEFSYNFAHFQRNKTRSIRGPPHGGDGKGRKGTHPPNFGFNMPSYLLTFQVTRPLDKLIYLGGASAAKTNTGEMDTQFLLSQIEKYEDFDEGFGAEKICKWGKENGGLDGIIRLEIGFEIILCDFFEKVELISNLQLTNITNTLGFPVEKFADVHKEEDEEDEDKNEGKHPLKRDGDDIDFNNSNRSALIDIYEAMAGYEHYEAGARVYNGENKILIDYSKLVTPLNKTYINPDPYSRRINNISTLLKSDILSSLNDILKSPNDPYGSTNWQLITDNIVTKFSPILQNLNSSFELYNSNHHDHSILGENITTYTFNFIRRYLNEPEYSLVPELRKLAIWDYAHPLQPLRSESDWLIWNSIVTVQSEIVDTLNGVYELGLILINASYNDGSTPGGIELTINNWRLKLARLLETFNWSIFYQCTKVCNVDEICFVPTWGPSPLGWGNSMLGYEIDEDGVKRISKDCVCISKEDLLHLNKGM